MGKKNKHVEKAAKLLGIDLKSGRVSQPKLKSGEDARKYLQKVREAEKEIKAAREETRAETRRTRADYSSKRSGVGKGVGHAVEEAVFGKKAVREVDSAERRRLRSEEEKSLGKQREVDRALKSALDGTKDLKSGIKRQSLLSRLFGSWLG